MEAGSLTTTRESDRMTRARHIDAILPRLAGRSLVLIGMMGAGKSSVGRRLAQALGVAFVDADDEIESAANMTIPEIFATHGEDYFRNGERRVIERLLEGGPQVLATGGGAFMNAETRENIAKKGISIWLKADFDVLMNRVRRRTHRPLLKDPDPEGVMRRLLAERNPVYAEANLTLHSRDVPHEMVVDDLLASLAHYLESETADRAETRQESL